MLKEAQKQNGKFLKDCDGNHMTIIPQSCDATAGSRLEVMLTDDVLSLTFFVVVFFFSDNEVKVEGHPLFQ